MSRSRTPIARIRRSPKASIAGSRDGASQGVVRPRSALRAAAAALLMLGLLLTLAAPASASKSIVNTIGSTTATGSLGAEFNFPRGIAVNKTGNGGVDAGTFYVVDTNNRRVQRFNPDSSFEAAWGWDVAEPDGDAAYEICTDAENCRQADGGTNPGQLSIVGAQTAAVDQETGVVYVADQSNRRINVYSATGEFHGAFGWGVADGTVELQFCTTTCGASSPAGADAGRFGFMIGGLAVSTSGQVYVANKANRRVDVFTPTYTGDAVTGIDFTRAFGWGVDTGAAAFEVCTTASTCQTPAAAGAGDGQFGTNSPTEVAFDASGRLLALDGPNKRIQLFDVLTDPDNPAVITSSFAAAAITDVFATGNLYSLVTDQVTDHAYLVGSDPASNPANQIRVLEIDNTGAEVDVHGTDLTPTSANGIGVAPPALGGSVYVSSNQGGSRLYVLNQAPEATLDDVTIFDTTTATFSGTADPTGASATCTFQYSVNGIEWSDLPATDCDSLDPNGGPQAVSEDVTGLEPATFYRVRLRVVKAGGAGVATTAVKTFTTDPVPPVVNDTFAVDVGATTATLKAVVNAKNQETSYYFQYTDEDDFQLNDFDNATQAPDPAKSAGSQAGNTTVSQSITGLDPATTYRFRVVVENPSGVVEGPDESFTTYAPPPVFDTCENDELRTGPSADLPDCRAYEQASPIDKNGQDVRGSVNIMAAGDDGDSILYYAANGQPGGVGPQSFPFYLAQRSEDQWSAGGIKPPLSFGDQASLLGWTPSLDSFFFGTLQTGVGATPALHARDSSGGAFTEISDDGDAGRFLGSSADGNISYFESQSTLAPGGVAGRPSIYAWNRATGEVRLASVLSDDACGSPPCQPLGGAELTADYPNESHPVNPEGDVVFSGARNGQLYMRRDPFGTPSTIHLSANQSSALTAPRPAHFEYATPDGEHVFFTSSAELTDESNTGPDEDPPAIGRADSADGGNVDINHVPLAETAPNSIESDENHLYWIEPDNESIGRSDLDGQNVEHDFITGLDNPKDLAVDSDHIYWTNAATDLSLQDGTIGRAELGPNPGDPATDVDQACATGFRSPRGIDVNENLGRIYWAHERFNIAHADISGDCSAVDASKVLNFASVGGGAPIYSLAVNDTHIYASSQGTFPSVVLRLTRIDITDGSSAGQMLINLPGLTEAAVAVDDSHFYWGRADTGAIGRADLDLSNRDDSFITDLTAPVGLAAGEGADSGHLYWATGVSSTARGTDLYRYEAASDDLVDLTFDEGTPLGADVRGFLGASDDGESVFFVANGDLDGDGPAEPGDCSGEAAGITPNGASFSGECSVYHIDGGGITFVARLDIGMNVPGGTFIDPERSDALNWVGARLTSESPGGFARVSADGDSLVFRSRESLTGYDNTGPECGYPDGNATLPAPGPCVQLYRYEVDEGIQCISCNPTGVPPREHATVTGIDFSGKPDTVVATLPRYVSPDGNRILFESAERLIASDTNSAGACPKVKLGNQFSPPSCTDVYEWEAEGTGTCESDGQNGGCLYLLSRGKGSYPSFLLDASENADSAFIFTRDQLVPQDEDSLIDAYAVRVDGGLASQHEDTSAQGCTGDDCQGGAESPPPTQQNGSGSFTGEGNQQSSDRSACSSEQRKLKKAKRKLKRVKGKAKGKRAKAKKRLKRAKKAKRKAQKRLRSCKGGER